MIRVRGDRSLRLLPLSLALLLGLSPLSALRERRDPDRLRARPGKCSEREVAREMLERVPLAGLTVTADQAFAETTNGGSGSLSLQSSRNAVRRSGSRPATCAPDGATPSVNGSHQSSNVACSTSTATALSTMSPIPAARKRSARWPALLPS